MIKAKKYNLADTNIANLGSKLEHNVKAAAASKEKQWANAGSQLGLLVWRIIDFQVVPVPENQYGQFYEKDAYIVLRTYKADPKLEKLNHDIHFWIGGETGADESGTAAYKTVELDDMFNGSAHQYREVEHSESAQFLSLFAQKGGLRLLSGGHGSGFHHVKPEDYKTRLFKIKGRRHPRVAEVPLAGSSINSCDVFILDAGLKIYQFNGSKSNGLEKNRGCQVAASIENERKIAKTIVFSEGDADAKVFWDLLGGQPKTIPSVETDDADWEKQAHKRLLQISDDGKGTPSFKKLGADSKWAPEVAKSPNVYPAPDDLKSLTKNLLDTKEAYIVDLGPMVFVWIGAKAAATERRGALKYATQYLTSHNLTATTPIARIFEGDEPAVFKTAFQ